jgi:DNA ligase D-like protein (predicted ligase)
MSLDVPRPTPAGSAGLSFVPPLLPTLSLEPPSGKGWIHELKHDGNRTILVIDGAARSFTRNGHDWSSRYRNIVECAARLRCRTAILDGEAIVQDERGISDFNALRGAMAWEPHRLAYFAFDLLHLDGEDLRRRPLLERKERLAELLGSPDPFCPIQFCDHLAEAGSALFEAAERMGLEGIVSKKASSTYLSGRSTAWLKIKCMTDGEFVVIGTSKGDGGPPVALLAREAAGQLVYAGSAFVTLAAPARDAFWSRASELAAAKSALSGLKNRNTTWCRPEMRVRARHLRGSGMIRHAAIAEVL